MGFSNGGEQESAMKISLFILSFRRYRLQRKIRRGGTKLPVVHQQT
jgi:hypothetical protein